MTGKREFKESPMVMGVDEKKPFTLTVPTSWSASVSTPTVVIKDSGGNDVTSTNATGSASASGQVITTPLIHSLTAGQRYRMEIKWLEGSNILEAFGFIEAET